MRSFRLPRSVAGQPADRPTVHPQLPSSERITLRHLAYSDRDEFLAMVEASRDLHRPWAYPPHRPDQFDELVARCGHVDSLCLLACDAGSSAIAGVFTVSQIVRGAFQSAFLGYYASAEFAGRGYMREGIGLVLDYSFGPLALHRLEANIQPANARSIALARSAGFRLEGYSPRYLLIGGQWRDHERYALTADERARAARSEEP